MVFHPLNSINSSSPFLPSTYILCLSGIKQNIVKSNKAKPKLIYMNRKKAERKRPKKKHSKHIKTQRHIYLHSQESHKNKRPKVIICSQRTYKAYNKIKPS